MEWWYWITFCFLCCFSQCCHHIAPGMKFQNIHLIFYWIPIAVRVQFTFFSLFTRTLMLEYSPAPSHSIPHSWHLKPQTTCSSSIMSCSHLLSFYHCGMSSILSFYFNNNFCLSHFSSNLSKFRMPSWPKPSSSFT